MPKVSIIIPIYNAEAYLRRCLDSVVNQTLKDIEIICVNDCSSDSSINILLEYVARDSRMKIIDCNVNGGESKARNLGIDAATGEYLAFVDNDDEVDLDFYEKLYEKGIAEDADISKGEVKDFDYQGQLKPPGEYHQILRETGRKIYFLCNWWTAIYRTSFIRKHAILLPEGFPLGGDMLFINRAVLNANKVAWTDGCFYTHLSREDSGDSKTLSSEKVQSALKIFEMVLANLNEAYRRGDLEIDEYAYAYKYNMGGIYLGNKAREQEDRHCCAKFLIDNFSRCLEKEKVLNLFVRQDQYTIAYSLRTSDTQQLANYFITSLLGQKIAMDLRCKLKYKILLTNN